MRRLISLLVVCAVAAPAVWAGELAGVTMSEEATVDAGSLTLNGMGLRKKMWVKVYVAGLYLENTTGDAAEAVSAGGNKKVVMHFLTNKATKKKMDAAWFEGFEANSPSEYPALEERVRQFAGYFGDMKVGDIIEITIVSGGETAVVFNGEEKGVIAGADFATALLKVWLGEHPPSADLQAGMLGG